MQISLNLDRTSQITIVLLLVNDMEMSGPAF